MGSIGVKILAQEKQKYSDSIIDYHRRALIIYTLIPNNLKSQYLRSHFVCFKKGHKSMFLIIGKYMSLKIFLFINSTDPDEMSP